MTHIAAQHEAAKQTAKVFFIAYAFACVLFWWLPSILFWLVGVEDPIGKWALWVSVLGLGAFTTGYMIPPLRFRREIPIAIVDGCESLAWKATLWIAAPAILLAVHFSWYRAGVTYGQGESLTFLDQAVFYTHLFFGFLFLGTARTAAKGKRRILVASILVILPRLIVSLHWGRFFLVQAIAPILFIALARGWVRLTAKRWLELAALVPIIVLVPALTRGDRLSGQSELIRFIAAGSSLRLFQDNADLNLNGRCPPLLVSMTDKLIPYSFFGVCTVDLWGKRNLPATLDRILTYNDPSVEGTLQGTGSNYLLELYLSGGIVVVIIGSIIFGFTNRCFIDWIGQRSLFAGIWAECLSRSLFAPRSTLGYVYERIPSLIIVTMLVIVTVTAVRADSQSFATKTGITPQDGTQ
jgi:hypothetical protein